MLLFDFNAQIQWSLQLQIENMAVPRNGVWEYNKSYKRDPDLFLNDITKAMQWHICDIQIWFQDTKFWTKPYLLLVSMKLHSTFFFQFEYN